MSACPPAGGAVTTPSAVTTTSAHAGCPPALPFWQRLVDWQRQQGRHHLPWQQTQDPYKVWLSEIMLQQTQVSTVLGYYQRFLDAFPGVWQLAEASEDQVLALWSGLGYYSRARNLHRCAQHIAAQCHGHFPTTAAQWQQLPGIGPSTAAAIAAFCFGERISIMDANVQRVLARHAGFWGDLASSAQVRLLADTAAQRLPDSADAAAHMPAYTQGLMDLGAAICTPRQPSCSACPVQHDCVAYHHHAVQHLPVKTRKLVRRSASHWLLFVQTPAGIWLCKRPSSGIWAGLYAPPMFDSEAALHHALRAIPAHTPPWHAPVFKHVLTHRDLYLHPVLLQTTPPPPHTLPTGQWVQDWTALGLPAPLRKWLDTHLADSSKNDTMPPAPGRITSL